jgi:hypothetical protein
MGKKGTSKWQGKFIKNQTFGNWTVLDETVIVDSDAKIKCRCLCGTEKYVSVYTLVKGYSTQCLDCGNSLKQDKNPAWKGVGKVPGKYIKRIPVLEDRKFAAKLLEEQNFKCALTGMPISFSDNTASLDRIDSSKPYIKGNMQWLHKDVNIMKNAYNINYFINMCRIICERTKDIQIDETITAGFKFGSR